MKWIITGLGNPEPQYKHTRHNAGRAVLDALQGIFSLPDYAYKKANDALICKGEISGSEAVLIAPQTYMNESGKSLIPLVKHIEDAAQLVVIYDDIDLPLGTWKLSWDRGSGGHNGIKSIESRLKTKAFLRVRIGILPTVSGEVRKPKGAEAVLNFVLGKFTPDERKLLEKVAKEVASIIPLVLTLPREKVMSSWNQSLTAKK